jgi:hypothetical protein
MRAVAGRQRRSCGHPDGTHECEIARRPGNRALFRSRRRTGQIVVRGASSQNARNLGRLHDRGETADADGPCAAPSAKAEALWPVM